MGGTQVPVREVGYVVSSPSAAAPWQALVSQVEESPELQWPDALSVFQRMYDEDTQVQSVVQAVMSPILSTTWRLDPNGAPDEVVQHVARDLGLPIKGSGGWAPRRLKGAFSWAEHLEVVLENMLVHGHAVFEQVYHPPEQPENRAHLRKLGVRQGWSIVRWNVARDGGLESVVQRASGNARADITIPVSRLVVYSRKRRGGEWWGRSIIRPAYKNWLTKDVVLRVGAQAIDRNGMGVPLYTGAPGETNLEKGHAIATGLRAGDNAGAAIAEGADLELLGVQGEIIDPLPFIQYQDEQIARAVLAHFLNLGQQTGSWALGETFANFFVGSLTAVAGYIATTATQHIVEDIVDVNFGLDVPAPRIVFDDLMGASGVLAEVIRKLVEAGVLTADEALEAHSRVVYGLPEGDQSTTRTTDQEAS